MMHSHLNSRHFLLYLFGFCTLFGVSDIQAQQVEENEQGERIIRFDDGSWRYYEPADSVYLGPSDLQILNRKITQSEKHLDKLQGQVEDIQTRKFNLQKAQKKNSYNRDILQSEIDSLIQVEEELRSLLQSLEFELEEMILRKSAMDRPKPNQQTLEGDIKPHPVKENRSLYSIPHYSRGESDPCNIQKSRIPGSDGVRWATEPQRWFHHTPKLLEHKYPDKPYLSGYASILNDGQAYYMHLKIEIRDPDAPKNYGWIDNNSPLFILTMHGETIEIRSQQESFGQKDSQAGVTRYTILYTIDPDRFNQLRNQEINKLRLVWSSGYEDYDIYKIRFLQKQIHCLERKIK